MTGQANLSTVLFDTQYIYFKTIYKPEVASVFLFMFQSIISIFFRFLPTCIVHVFGDILKVGS
jgi:hypothetical protein